MKKRLFIEELEVRQSSSPLFIAPIDPNLMATTMAVGEEGGPIYTTQAVGEEGGPIYTTQAVGEEGGPIYTTQAVGEEGGWLK
ncbi:hypothetical protein FE784_23245 [Paenibacillus hemerocallicola]|jgi:hypothetical protein|uniref:Uncharacterized protein n=1 Tax=Paenibacillus hemerocallicola TaxID=1172614 RepID=A0A5C4T4S3_9BACL|nr:hypothetical protein [Paenibacillus hemerocallicola]TNJ63795.1 hypothetical protein FE784_23245 [Paenibacillus hemerocallicola]